MALERVKKYMRIKGRLDRSGDSAFVLLKELERLEELTKSAKSDFDTRMREIQTEMPRIVESIRRDLKASLRIDPEVYRGDKGDKGDAGESIQGPPGPRGDEGPPGPEGKTPVAGLDYPSEEDFVDLVQGLVSKAIAPLDQIVKKALGVFFDSWKPNYKISERIARGLETLKGKDRLDYYALKNLPDIPKSTSTKGSTMRGGGQKVEYYDLTPFTDGVTKAFTIPTNKRVLAVFGTDFPIVFRPLVDWVSAGTTLTLTSEVPAPQSGATLQVLYIP